MKFGHWSVGIGAQTGLGFGQRFGISGFEQRDISGFRHGFRLGLGKGSGKGWNMGLGKGSGTEVQILEYQWHSDNGISVRLRYGFDQGLAGV